MGEEGSRLFYGGTDVGLLMDDKYFVEPGLDKRTLL